MKNITISSGKGLSGIMILAALLVFASGCSIDRKLAKEFVQSEERPPVILKQPSAIYMVSYKDTDTDTSGLAKWQIDSVRFHESAIIKNVNPQKFKASFFDAFKNQFSNYGFEFYEGQKLKALFENDTIHPIVVSFPQMELEEYIQPYSDVGYVKGREYFKNFDLDAVNLNAWLNLSMRGREGQEFYFISDSITDKVRGFYFEDDETRKVRYKYKYRDVDEEDMYRFAQDMGTNYAQYIFDHYMNRFIKRNRNSSAPRRFLYHYDPQSGDFLLIKKLPWIRMEMDEVLRKK